MASDAKAAVDLGGGYSATVRAWSGNARPYDAEVRHAGLYVGQTGFAKTPGGALTAARRLVARQMRFEIAKARGG